MPSRSNRTPAPAAAALPASAPGGRLGGLRADALAGLTVAVMSVPQAMAYALILNLPPIYGLYTAIVPCLVAAILGSSNHLVTGPTNALCMVILSLAGPLALSHGVGMLEVVLLLTLLTGALQLAFGLLRLGGIVRYVSNSVVVGFTAGAGLLIAANQLRNLLGIEVPHDDALRFHDVLLSTLSRLGETNPYALTIGGLTAALAFLAPRLDRRVPGPLLAIVAAAIVSWALGWHLPEAGPNRVTIMRDLEPIRGTLAGMFRVPALVAHPDWGLVRDLSHGAVALALLGLVEAASVARSVAASSGQRLDFNREFVGQGAANLVGAFFSGFAASGSLTRSAVCWQAGGRTRRAAAFSALWTALTVALLAPFANAIPRASLAGLLIVVAWSMIEKNRLRLTWRSGRNSRLVLGGTLLATLVLPLEYAIFVGVFLSLVILLQITGRTDLTHLVPHEGGGFDEVPFNRAAPSPVVTINMEGDLYFAAVDDLDYELLRSLTPSTRVVVLRMKRLRAVGSTAMAILEHFWEILRARDVRLVVCGIEEDLQDVLTNSGLRQRIGEHNIFYADNKLFQSTELAHARAWSLVESERQRGGPGDVERIRVAPPLGGAPGGPTARELMTERCIRFGVRHSLREAVWLVSEIHRHEGGARAPQPLFLQDREGRLAAALTPERLLRELTRFLDPDVDRGVDDLRERMRRRFDLPIREIARTDLPVVGPGTSAAEMLRIAADAGLAVLPVTDDHGRVVGLVEPETLLRALAGTLGIPVDDDEGAAATARPDLAGDPPSPERDLGRALCRPARARVSSRATLRDAAAALIAARSAAGGAAGRTIVVEESDGRPAGLVPVTALLAGIAGVGLDAPVRAFRRRDPNRARPTDGLARLAALTAGADLDLVPCVEGGRILGVVGLGDVFRVAAATALAPRPGEPPPGA